MRVVTTRADGVTIYKGRFMVARVFAAPVERQKPMARQFAASDEMLAVCQKLLDFEQKCNDNPDGMMHFDALVEVTEMARAVIARVEGES